MPILRRLPLFGRPQNRLLGNYHEKLRTHWGPLDRALGTGLDLLGVSTGWSLIERRILPSEVRASGVSMADRRGIHRLLNPAGFPVSRSVLLNKAMFARHAAAHGLPVPASFDPESGSLEDWLRDWPAIIAKRGYSSKGEGITAYRRHGDHWRGTNRTFKPLALAARLRPILASHGVVQELLDTHDELKPLSPGALPTLRIVTCIDEAGDPEVGATILRLGSGGPSPVDNFNAGGLAVRLDAGGRCLGALRASGQVTDVHPATGAKIAGFEVPEFDASIELARRAHRTLESGFTVVGWDIGLADRGPTLVEGNWNPGTRIIQLVDGVGLDRTRLGELYRFHLGRVAECDWRSARAIEW